MTQTSLPTHGMVQQLHQAPASSFRRLLESRPGQLRIQCEQVTKKLKRIEKIDFTQDEVVVWVMFFWIQGRREPVIQHTCIIIQHLIPDAGFVWFCSSHWSSIENEMTIVAHNGRITIAIHFWLTHQPGPGWASLSFCTSRRWLAFGRSPCSRCVVTLSSTRCVLHVTMLGDHLLIPSNTWDVISLGHVCTYR